METINHTLLDGIILTLFKGDHITNQIVNKNNYYESAMLNFIKFNITKGIMIDVGSNCGNHTIYLAKYCATKVISYEPFPSTFQLLERNVIQNNLINVHLMNLGLSNENKEMFMSSIPGNIGMAKIDDDGKTLIKVVSFDSTAAKLINGNITLIKIDCEGYEEKAILGMMHTIKNHLPAIFVECQTEEDLNNMRKLLNPLGYKDIYKFNATPTYYFSI